MPFCEKAQSFKYGAIAQLVAISNQLGVISVVPFEICAEAIGDVLDPTPYRRIVEHINDSTMNIRDENFCAQPPDRFGSEEFISADVFERELETRRYLGSLSKSLSCHNDDVFEDLLRQIPQLYGRQCTLARIALAREPKHRPTSSPSPGCRVLRERKHRSPLC